jgi:hypothetical protein
VIVLDTTVLVYAVGAQQHLLRDPCRRIVEGVREQRIDATTTVGVLLEFAHVRARRRSREDAAALTGEFLELLAPLVVEEHQLRAGLALYQPSERLGAFDSVLASTALHAGAQALVSADVSFADVRNLRHVIPDARSVEVLEAM